MLTPALDVRSLDRQAPRTKRRGGISDAELRGKLRALIG